MYTTSQSVGKEIIKAFRCSRISHEDTIGRDRKSQGLNAAAEQRLSCSLGDKYALDEAKDSSVT